jgi:hypothetical protein
MQIGQELPFRVKNDQGAGVVNGNLVYISGGQGSQALFKLADPDSDNTARVFGMATEDIAKNQFGYVTTIGYVRGSEDQPLNTSSWAAGTQLFLDDDGAFTATEPTAPRRKTCIGRVIRQHATEGVIFVCIHVRPDLDELSNVYVSGTPNDGEILAWNTSNSRYQIVQSTRRALTEIDDTDSPYTQLATDQIIYCDTSAGAIEIDLIAIASANGQTITINCSGDNTVTLDPNGAETINGNTSLILVDGDSAALHPNSTEWRII